MSYDMTEREGPTAYFPDGFFQPDDEPTIDWSALPVSFEDLVYPVLVRASNDGYSMTALLELERLIEDWEQRQRGIA